MIGGRLLTAALALLLSGAGGVAAQDAAGPLPERRITVEPGVDFYGSDLRSIFGTTLPICRDACLAESACTAFTFNTAASACFLKSDDGARTAFPAALSATLAPQPEGLAARAAARAAELGFLPAERLAAAREAALSAGFPPVNPVAEAAGRGGPGGDACRGQPNRCGGGLGGTLGPCRGSGGRGLEPAVLAARPRGLGRDQRLPAGRYRRGGRRGRPADRRRARGGGRGPGVARRAAPRRVAGAGTGDRGRGGARRGALRLSRASTGRSTSRRRARGPASTSPSRWQAPGSTTPISSGSTPGPIRSRRGTGSSASTGSRMAAATR